MPVEYTVVMCFSRRGVRGSGFGAPALSHMVVVVACLHSLFACLFVCGRLVLHERGHSLFACAMQLGLQIAADVAPSMCEKLVACYYS